MRAMFNWSEDQSEGVQLQLMQVRAELAALNQKRLRMVNHFQNEILTLQRNRRQWMIRFQKEATELQRRRKLLEMQSERDELKRQLEEWTEWWSWEQAEEEPRHREEEKETQKAVPRPIPKADSSSRECPCGFCLLEQQVSTAPSSPRLKSVR